MFKKGKKNVESQQNRSAGSATDRGLRKKGEGCVGITPGKGAGKDRSCPHRPLLARGRRGKGASLPPHGGEGRGARKKPSSSYGLLGRGGMKPASPSKGGDGETPVTLYCEPREKKKKGFALAHNRKGGAEIGSFFSLLEVREGRRDSLEGFFCAFAEKDGSGLRPQEKAGGGLHLSPIEGAPTRRASKNLRSFVSLGEESGTDRLESSFPLLREGEIVILFARAT